MKVNILNKKFIKPSTPTSPNLKNYNLSCIDNVYPLMYVPIILFYESSPNKTTKNIINHLQDSLAKILPDFYPFAGRYIAKDHLVDCSDQGVEFIEARVAADEDDGDLEILEFIKQVNSSELLDVLLPQEQVSLQSIQVTTFKCGGVAIGVSTSHKLVDTASIETFVSAWANASNRKMAISPVFYSPAIFPCSNPQIGLGPKISGSTKPSHVAKMFVFDKEMITSLKAKIRSWPWPASQGKRNPASRVRVVCAFIAKALIRLERAKSQQPPRDCRIIQAFDIRERTIPCLPKHSCGNMATVVHCSGSDNMEFEELVELQTEAIARTTADCADILCSDESNVHRVLVNPVADTFAVIGGGEINILPFSDWTKFRFYGADFGWGKPIWTSIGTMALEKFVVLMENKEGDGVEVWVHLNDQDMAWFEQDEEMRTLLPRI